MVEPDVMEATTSRIVISSEEGETAGEFSFLSGSHLYSSVDKKHNLVDLEAKTLSELSIGNGTMLMCDDFQQKLELKVILAECKTMKGDEFEVCMVLYPSIIFHAIISVTFPGVARQRSGERKC